MNKIKVGIIGATGYAGCELVRLLYSHPNAEIVAISSVSYLGKDLAEVYPIFTNIFNQVLTTEDEVIAKSDIVFASLPHGLSEVIASKCVANGVKLIDLGADFRLSSEEDYKEWYKLDYKFKDLHKTSCYCVPELHRHLINDTTAIIANPGCYPTSVALGLAPLASKGLINSNIVIDSKSGTTGAGRGLTQTTHYPDCNENFAPYKVAMHRHTPEIEENLRNMTGKDIMVTFVPHLLPINRGIISTIYVDAKSNLEELYTLYSEFYKDEQFVRVLNLGETACIKNVRMSNYCDISVHYDSRCGKVIIVSTIDNMVKGASGQAIQNMNILFGIAENTGLDMISPAF